MENRSSPETDDYRYFDPKLLRGNENMARARSTFTEAIVFVVGGGNYVEYENMRDYCQVAIEHCFACPGCCYMYHIMAVEVHSS